jgi:tetratricopeptide (TPR) repeat protein
MGRRLGIIIGINSYQDPAFRTLQYAENDTRALAQWLVNTKGGNWAPSDVQHVLGAYATRELVETLITHTCTHVAGPGDLVFVYFAGHAFLDEASGQGYLALANTRYQQPSTGLHLPALAQQSMSSSRAAHIAFILDCFQTGPIWNMQRSSPYDSKPLLGPTILNALQQVGDRLICCSCRGNQLVPESGVKNLGNFTYQMIFGLCGPAIDPATKHVTLQGLHAYLFNSLGEQQRPQLFGREYTPLVLVGDMPALTTPQQSGPLPSAFSPGVPQAPPAQPASTGSLAAQPSHYSTATAQMSPTSSGQLTLSEAEQQCSMLLSQARHLIQMQKPGEAFNCVEQALQIDPTNIAALILKGQLLGTASRFEEALYVVELVLQLDPDNALVWSMRAALLTNTGQYQAALQAIERSLELDPNNPETYALKTSIMDRIATFQNQGNGRGLTTGPNKRGGPRSFFISAGIQFLGLALGIVGATLPIIQPRLPIVAAFVLQSLGLALLCVNAARGSYLHGFARFLFTLFTSALAAAILVAVAILGGANKIGTGRIYLMLKSNPALLVPVLFLGLWLALAAAAPLLLALGGFIGGLILGVRRKKR